MKTLLIVLGVIIVLAVVYFLVAGQGGQPAPSTGGLATSTGENPITAEPATEAETTSDDLLSLLRGIDNLQLDDSIFSNPSFDVLVDIGTELQRTGQTGRGNPFLPIGLNPAGTPSLPTTSTDPGVSSEGTTIEDFLQQQGLPTNEGGLFFEPVTLPDVDVTTGGTDTETGDGIQVDDFTIDNTQ